MAKRAKDQIADMVDDPLLQEIRARFSYATTEWHEIRQEGAKDVRYVTGDTWDDADRRQREEAKRPVLSFDELNQYVNQGINELRMNKRSIKFTPTGNGANEDTAQFYSDKMREIEYRSKASSIHYITAAENMFQRGYGFIRITTKYEHPRSVNQDLWIESFPNPDLVTPDPDAQLPTLADMKFCFVREPYEEQEFLDRWGEAKIRSFGDEAMALAPNWIKEGRIYVGEYWKVKSRKRKLLIFSPPGAPEPMGYFQDEVLDSPQFAQLGPVTGERMVDDQSVCQYVTNGLETLETNEWPGKYIPIIACLGKVLYVTTGGKTRKVILSMVRLARDPQQMYNYIWSGEAEVVGMTPKFPYFAYENQLTPLQLTNLQKSTKEPVPVILIKPAVEGSHGNLLPFPQRQPYEPPLQAFEIAKESARRAIQAAMGQTPLPTAAQRQNEKSGKALDKMEQLVQRGSFHLADHYTDMIEHAGVVAEDLMDKILDSPRQTGIRQANDSAKIVRVNDPSDPKAVSTKGDHLVTVSTGPSFDSEREAASDFADTLAQISPEVFQLLGPMIVKLKNLGPIGDEIAELLEAMQPPQIQALKASKGDQADPKQQLMVTMREKQDLEKMVQELSKELEARVQQIETDQFKLEAQHKTQIALQEMKNAATIRVAEINAAVKGYQTEAAHAAQHEEQALNIEAEAVEADLEREQTSHEAERQRQHETQQAREGVVGQMAVQAAKPPPKNGNARA